MIREEKLQYAIDNYSIGNKVSRKNFYSNDSECYIIKSDSDHHFFGESIYLGKTQIYCGRNHVWAKNLTIKTKQTTNYEIY